MATGTLAQDVGRMDILLHRGITERVGVRWTQNGHDGQSNPITMPSGGWWTVTDQTTADDDDDSNGGS